MSTARCQPGRTARLIHALSGPRAAPSGNQDGALWAAQLGINNHRSQQDARLPLVPRTGACGWSWPEARGRLSSATREEMPGFTGLCREACWTGSPAEVRSARGCL